MKESQEKARKAIYNLAKGMMIEEITEDYVVLESGEIEMQKKRIVKKMLPPDIEAYKLLYGEAVFNDLSDEELEKEKQRLIKQLLSIEKKENKLWQLKNYYSLDNATSRDVEELQIIPWCMMKTILKQQCVFVPIVCRIWQNATKKQQKQRKRVIKMKKKNLDLENQQLVAKILNDFEERKLERKPFERQWQTNANFVVGNQFCSIDSLGNTVNFDSDYEWQENQVYNYLASMYESRLAKLARVRPQMTVLPSTSEEKDIKSAKVSKSILKSVEHKLNLSRIIAKATKWSELTGTVFYKVIWNSDSGRTIGIDEKGRSIKEGDVEITVCPPFEIYPDNVACESIEDCRSIIHARAYHIDQIKQNWGIDVKGEDIDVISCDSTENATGANFMAMNTSVIKTTKKNHAIVLEYYERPSFEYPKGRLVIVAGKQLVFNGDLPFQNEEDKQYGFPFVRQISQEQSNNFFGSTIINRIIPLQRALNATKNRKYEFMNRIAQGILAVEDGSVDTDLLEEEGMKPGKILVYRQGSTPPSYMASGGLPGDFSAEEDRIMNQMTVMSGLSDLTSAITTYANMSGTALRLLIEQDDAKLTTSAEEIRSAIKIVGAHILRLYKQFVTNKRVGRIIGGDNREVELFYFDSSNISSEDIVFETENELTETVAQRRSMVFELLNAGLLTDENGKLNNRMRSKVLELLGYGIWEQGQDMASLQRNKAQKENISCVNDKKQLEVQEIDDHEIHIVEHTAFLLTDTLSEDNEQHLKLREMILNHISEHKNKISEKNLNLK